MTLTEQSQLQESVLLMLNVRNFDYQIHLMATKELPLTSRDIAQLEHFLTSDRNTRKRTIYWGNTIISSPVHNKTTVKIGDQNK